MPDPTSTARTTALSQRALPGPASTSQHMPWAETAVFVAVVPLLTVPILLASMADAWAVGTTLALTALVSWLCLAKRVVIGDGWLARPGPRRPAGRALSMTCWPRFPAPGSAA